MKRFPCSNVKWIFKENNFEIAKKLSMETNIHPVIAAIFANRGIKSSEDVHNFLSPSLSNLHSPDFLPDIQKAIIRIKKAISKKELIRIYGDYDADGITASAVLVRVLRAFGGNVDYRLPHRYNGGYGLNVNAVNDAAADRVRVIITCDCGISAFDSARRAQELGIDLIITDHHEPSDILPCAYSIINPKRHDSKYPFRELSGVGVALKLCQALSEDMGVKRELFLDKFLDLVSIGTVVDVVPLVDENRIIAYHGLKSIPQSKKIGLKTLLKITQLDEKPLTTFDLGFVLGPRINAVGRMGDATQALELFLTKDENIAYDIVGNMNEHNIDRRTEQERILKEALEQVRLKNLDQNPVLVISNEGWSAGVLGIVAGKITESFYRPSILIGKDSNTGLATGSARSVHYCNIMEALESCDDLLIKYGGHCSAAGLTIPIENLDKFEEAINNWGMINISKDDMLPKIEIDAKISIDDINRKLVDTLEMMEPFGCGNEEPIFASFDVKVANINTVGNDQHCRLTLNSNNNQFICMAWRMPELVSHISNGDNINICYTLGINRFNGNEYIQMTAKSIELNN
ncbi:MAG: single-stranded-DNA-specific exonuclease RecJ [Armatimonadota bacterium]